MVQRRWWAPSLLLVKRVWSELKPRLGHGESINPSPRPAEVGRGKVVAQIATMLTIWMAMGTTVDTSKAMTP